MARLSDLVNVNINKNKVKIQGVDIPVIFTMRSFPYVEEFYGKPYHVFEKDIRTMLGKGKFVLGKKETKLMYALIYAMVRSGGTDCTPYELENSIPMDDLPSIFDLAFSIFSNQNFQKSDMEQIKTEKKKSVNSAKSQSEDELDWDFYFYVGNTLLGLSMNDFFDITPAHLLKQYIMHLRYHNPDALKNETTKRVYTLDQTPFL